MAVRTPICLHLPFKLWLFLLQIYAESFSRPSMNFIFFRRRTSQSRASALCDWLFRQRRDAKCQVEKCLCYSSPETSSRFMPSKLTVWANKADGSDFRMSFRGTGVLFTCDFFLLKRPRRRALHLRSLLSDPGRLGCLRCGDQQLCTHEWRMKKQLFLKLWSGFVGSHERISRKKPHNFLIWRSERWRQCSYLGQKIPFQQYTEQAEIIENNVIERSCNRQRTISAFRHWKHV